MKRSNKIKTMEKSTVDPQKMEIFDALAKVWWNKEGILKPLHALNNLRIPLLLECLAAVGRIDPNLSTESPLEGVSVLDVGCGGGILAEPLSLLGCKVTGIDPNIELINIARARASECEHFDLEYVCSTIEEYVLDNKEKYDVVIISETIEHVVEKEMFVKFCIECLSPGGSIFITTKCKSWSSKFIFITVAEKLLNYFPSGTHKYKMFIDVRKLQNLLERENCEVVFTRGIAYNFFTNKWSLISNPSFQHYVIHAVKQFSDLPLTNDS